MIVPTQQMKRDIRTGTVKNITGIKKIQMKFCKRKIIANCPQFYNNVVHLWNIGDAIRTVPWGWCE